MTTTLLCKGLSNLDMPAVPSSFLEDLTSTLSRLAPKYLGMVDVIGDYMLSYLYYSLDYWENTANTKLPFGYREVKIAEWFAFWTGFHSAGGAFPITSSTVHLPEHNACKVQPKQRRFFCVIPVGSINEHIKAILHSTLGALQKNRHIMKVYLVFDGVESEVSLCSAFPKVEVHSTPKRSGPAQARNIGLTEGYSKDYSDALLLDNDVLVNQAELTQLVNQYCLSGSPIACPLIQASGNSWLDNYHNLSGTLNGRYLKVHQNSRLLFGTTSTMLLSRQLYDAGLLFSSDFPDAAGEDIDYCLRAIFGGYSIAALDEVKVHHWYGYTDDAARNWSIFLSRFERYGKGEYLLAKKHPYYHYLISSSSERLGY